LLKGKKLACHAAHQVLVDSLDWGLIERALGVSIYGDEPNFE
jgi:hypothetical protein